jgi:SAM-dependent methyltransferase
LALIRWMGSQIRLVAYFQNLVLIAAFLGMGLGVALGRERPRLVDYALPALAGLSVLLAFSDGLGLMHARFPDRSVFFWGSDPGEAWVLDPLKFLGSVTLVVGLFWAVAGVFLLASAPIGYLFGQTETLRAYAADLGGSLLGVIAMTALAALGTGPVVWLAFAVLPLLWLSRKPSSLVAAAIVVICGAASVQGAAFSPYNRIDLSPDPFGDGTTTEWRLQVNRDFHQDMLDLSAPTDPIRMGLKEAYELPFRLHAGGRVLVVGAGTGNDVQAALRFGATEVVSVDIDGEILRAGTRLHPENPYGDPRTKKVENDARAYFEQNPDERFDVVRYGLLDSHAMFSAMSSLRLDNYVYTVEGLRSAWEHVKPDGILAVSFCTGGGQWMFERMDGILVQATGLTPHVKVHDGYGPTYIVGRELPLLPESASASSGIRIPTDDWPFLYLKPASVPYTYLFVLAAILATATLAVRRAFGGVAVRESFHLPLFLMGAAFMLLETRMVTSLGLLFGSTWVVNASVFAGILTLVLIATLATARRAPKRVLLWFGPLFLSLVVCYLLGSARLASLPLLGRGLAGGLLFALPVGIAGVVVATLLKQAKNAAGALGSNLLGAVLGGVLEYLSMLLGLEALLLLALTLYLGAFLALRRPGALD